VVSALLDTCVLVPSRARDVLLEVASAGVYRPLWSSEILAELDRTLRLLQARRGVASEETDAYLVRLFRQMETSFPDALVTDWEPLLDAVQLPDPGDRHVVAAARAGRADVIVTDNVADVPSGRANRQIRADYDSPGHSHLPPGPGHARLRRTPAGKPRQARPRVSNPYRVPIAMSSPVRNEYLSRSGSPKRIPHTWSGRRFQVSVMMRS